MGKPLARAVGEMISWIDHHQQAIVAIAALVAAFSSFMGWVCTVWSDWRTHRRFKTLGEDIRKSKAK